MLAWSNLAHSLVESHVPLCIQLLLPGPMMLRLMRQDKYSVRRHAVCRS